jgi:hypothetical protein
MRTAPREKKPQLWLLVGPALGTLGVGFGWAASGGDGDHRPLWTTVVFILCCVGLVACAALIWRGRRRFDESNAPS